METGISFRLIFQINCFYIGEIFVKVVCFLLFQEPSLYDIRLFFFKSETFHDEPVYRDEISEPRK